MVTDDELEFRAWKRHDYGGQQVGVATGVIVVHKATGIAAISTDERSQLANKRAARAKLERVLSLAKAAEEASGDLRARLVKYERVVAAARKWRATVWDGHGLHSEYDEANDELRSALDALDWYEILGD